MNPQSTSFIPHRPTQGKIQNRGVRKVYILTYVSYIVFFGTLLSIGGVLAYKFTLNAQLTRQQQLLSEERSKFKQADIESIKELEQRIDTSKDRMDKHVSVLSIFEAFEKAAVQSLRFASFTYTRKTDESPEVTITGDGDTFNSVLFQRDVLLANPILKAASVSGVALETSSTENEDGTPNQTDTKKIITFSISETLDPTLVRYEPRIPVDTNTDEFDSSQSEADVVDTTGDVEQNIEEEPVVTPNQ